MGNKVNKELKSLKEKWGEDAEKKSKGYTLLHYACYKGASSAAIRALCWSTEAKCTGEYGFTGWTPLHVASYYGKVEVVKALLGQNADIEAKDNSKCTPLHVASLKGKVEVVKELLGRKADIEAKTDNIRTPLHLASTYGHVEVVKALLDHTPPANINAKDNSEWTPLHYACENDHKEVVRLLVDRGADVNAKNKEGLTPAELTSKKKIKNILKAK